MDYQLKVELGIEDEGSVIVLDLSITPDTKPLVRRAFCIAMEKVFEEVSDHLNGEVDALEKDDFELPFCDAVDEYLEYYSVIRAQELIEAYGLNRLLHLYCMEGNTLSYDDNGQYCEKLVKFMMLYIFRKFDIYAFKEVVKAMTQIEGDFGGFEW